MSALAPIAITLGEPGGAGPELVGMAWLRRMPEAPVFYLVGDPAFIERRCAEAGLDVPVEAVGSPSRAAEVFRRALPVVATTSAVKSGHAGRFSAEDAGAVIEAIERAVGDVHSGTARAVVTAPIQKESLYGSGFTFPGHTEFLGELAARHWGGTHRPVMMLAAGDFRVVPVTIHIPLADVPEALTTEAIVETGRIVAGDLRKRFGLAGPRLAVAGLNPHAGEGGSMGTEDRDVVAPAVRALQEAGIDTAGPFPADTMFHAVARAGYDAALAMYHDQALIPIKTVAFDTAVNVTLGLPFVRTSPDHGTALSLAGTGRANPSSLIAAIELADRLSAGQ